MAWAGASPPPPEVIFSAVVILLAVTLGSGWLSTAFHTSLEETMHLALTDRGTGLPNRGHAALHLERAFAAARRGIPLSVVAFDLDHFKEVNDQYGHAVGDRVLMDFAGVLKRITREMNLSARIGGEEFLSILDGVPPEGAEVFTSRVLQALREKQYNWGSVTASAGIAGYEPGMASHDVLLAAADQALYRAKRAGRDRACVLRPAMEEALPVGESGSGIPKPGDPRRGRGELVLVVDDDPAVLRILARSLERMGYAVLEAEGPEQGLQVARGLREPLDLVITDVVMPAMSGFRFVELLEEQRPGLRTIYTSGYNDSDLDWSDVPGAVRRFLQKPVPMDTLASAVREALDAPLDGPLEAPAAAHSAA
jgi:diguanylate cyclase (GGDEF)-like protein